MKLIDELIIERSNNHFIPLEYGDQKIFVQKNKDMEEEEEMEKEELIELN